MAGWKRVMASAEADEQAQAATTAEVSVPGTPLHQWGGWASVLMAVALLVPQWIYLTGNLRAPAGRLVYALADLLYGPLWGAGLVVAVLALQERIGPRAPRRLGLALPAALIAAGAMVCVAAIRSVNRQYLLAHPELADELSTTLLTAWGTIVTAVSATGWHFLGWALLLIGSAAWSGRGLPRGLAALYLVTGCAALVVVLLPDLEGGVVALTVALSIWQGVVLWRAEPLDRR
jgi:hypothetical protein